VLALPLLCGHAGVPVSGVVTSTSGAAPVDVTAGDPTLDDRGRGEVHRRHVNMNLLGALLCGELPGPPASVLVVQGANPAVMNPAQTKVLAGLARDDLFTVVHDQVLTDTAALADVVLPATTHLEADDVATSYGSYTLQRLVPAIARVGESRTNGEVAIALAQRLGVRVQASDPDDGGLIDALVDGGFPAGGPVRVLRGPGTTVPFRDVFPSFDDWRARLHLPQGELPLPRYAPLDGPYPLTLITPATARTINSMLGEGALGGADATVHLSPNDAAARGLADGERVRMVDGRAALDLTLRVDADVRDGVCVMAKGLWRHQGSGGLTANAFAPDDLSDLAGGACFNDARVEVRRGTDGGPSHHHLHRRSSTHGH